MNANIQMEHRAEFDPAAGLPAGSAPRSKIRSLIPRPVSGWDPYEVWRTRVKSPDSAITTAPLQPKR